MKGRVLKTVIVFMLIFTLLFAHSMVFAEEIVNSL